MLVTNLMNYPLGIDGFITLAPEEADRLVPDTTDMYYRVKRLVDAEKATATGMVFPVAFDEDRVPAYAVFYGTAAPETGTYALGDRIYNTHPAAGGWSGWVCTVAGTPGTWKGFGKIDD